MSPRAHRLARPARGFTLVEALISVAVSGIVLTMCLGTFVFCLRVLYKDTARLETNASLRKFMAQVSKETLDASYFYLFPHYTKLDGNVNLATDVSPMTQILDAADNDYDKWVAHGDCLVLVTMTSTYRTTDIRQIRIYYRTTSSQATANTESTLRYYETADWGEGSSSTGNGHSDITAELNAINLNVTPSLSGSRRLHARTMGRQVPSPYTGYTAGDRYPIFASESPDATASNGFISINVEFVNGSTINNLLSSSSFNYTISPRR